VWVSQKEVRDLETRKKHLVEDTAMHGCMLSKAITVSVDYTIRLRALFVEKANRSKLLIGGMDEIREYSSSIGS
jgi:hypothetical protein